MTGKAWVQKALGFEKIKEILPPAVLMLQILISQA